MFVVKFKGWHESSESSNQICSIRGPSRSEIPLKINKFGKNTTSYEKMDE